jgi:hypothetical protein
MRYGLLGAASAAALGLLCAPAHAVLSIAFQSGLSSLQCQDGQICDLAGPSRNLLVLSQFIGAFHVEGSFAESGARTLSDSNLTITNTSGATQTLFFTVSDTGFAAPTHFINMSGSGTVEDSIGGSGSLSFHADALDRQGGILVAGTPNAPGTLLFNPSAVFGANPFAFDGNLQHDGFTASSPFSMTLDYEFTIRPGGSIVGLESAMNTSAIPEPRTWVMGMLGFGLLGLLGWKRKARTPRVLAI